MLPHRIRLRGPWQLTPLNRAGSSRAELPATVTATMPARWSECGLGDFIGRVRHVRRFGLPRSLDSFERVWLTAAGIAGRSEFWLNEQQLGEWPDQSPHIEIDVTRQLRERNEIRIEIDSESPGGGMSGDVALEIRGQAWLADLSADMHGRRLAIRGKLNGQADGPLDLYAIMGRFSVIQKQIETSAGSRRFEFISEPLPPERIAPAVQIELVSGSNIWHAAEIPLTNEE